VKSKYISANFQIELGRFSAGIGGLFINKNCVLKAMSV
jgi:hypothetical protein